MSFVHLHVHTQYSILDGQASIKNLFARAQELGMPGIAITDHGNMYGIKEFFKVAKGYPDIKPIVGCEVYVSVFDHKLKDKEHKGYYHLILLAKNYEGYKNLMKIVSTAHIEGRYIRPRVSHEVIEKYHENLICSSACLAGEVPRKIMAGDIAGAEEAIEWHKRVFGDDYYLEVMLHKTEVPGLSQEVWEKQKEYCAEIFRLAPKYGVKVIATNDVHFVRREDGPAHDRLICLTTNAYIDEPNRLRYTQQEFLKSEEEMLELFPDHPEAISNTLEVLDKVERYEIDRGHVLPKFELPDCFLSDIDSYLTKYQDVIEVGKNDEKGNDRGEEFRKSVAYLCELCYKGAERRYGELDEEQRERIDFELKTISRMGFPDYFLIVQDFINHARSEGISVGPGRGSAAGSAVAYCLGITNLDPIRYNLLFERFLNPERISMPDIDVDFDDEGRYKVIQYVQERYGVDHVSHVITFGTMAAKMAIKDVARISRMSIDESNRLTKLVPDRPIPYKDADGKEQTAKINLKNCMKYVPEFKEAYEQGTDLTREVLDYATQLEGSVRQTGIHACAMIIGRGDLTDYIPITLGVDKATGQEVWVSQYEGSYIEEVGMLKMDFLGLSTLSIIKECLSIIKKRHGVDIDIDHIPIDDPETFALYSRGDTQSVFQFESPGMKEWLQKLHPERFEDLIAMNALYRPGPMDYIPDFVGRKRGDMPIEYDLPDMEEYLKETYGVTVYQEQVMLISQKVAGFSKGKADKLRKAMGKKKIDILQSLHDEFIEGAVKRGHPQDTLEKIWKDWEKFASYAFNKSHATCYAWVSYQTGWLKAHYPSEFQAANLSQNLGKMDEIKKIMDDCKKNHIKVLNPDVNESESHFTVNQNGDVRFGLGGIKRLGDNVVSAIMDEREAHGKFADVFDFVERMSGAVNRKSMEALIYSGAFDSFGILRNVYFIPCNNGNMFVDELISYGARSAKGAEDNTASLFGEVEELKPQKPDVPQFDYEPDQLELLQKEKEFVGMYLSSHPLDKYRFEISNFTNISVSDLNDLVTRMEMEGNQKKDYHSVKVSLAGFITSYTPAISKTGRPWSKTVIEDYNGSYELALFGKDHESWMGYMQDVHTAVYIEGEVGPKYYIRKGEVPQKAMPYGFKISKVSLLGNIADDKIKSFHVLLNTRNLTPELRAGLVSCVDAHPGSIPLGVNLVDDAKKYNIDFISRKKRVTVTTDFLSALEELGIPTRTESK